MLARGMLTIEGVLANISPDTNVVQIAKQHILKNIKQNLDIKKNWKKSAQSIYVSAEKALDIPGLTTDLLNMTLWGQTRFNLDLAGSKSLMDQFNRIMNKLIVLIIVSHHRKK